RRESIGRSFSLYPLGDSARVVLLYDEPGCQRAVFRQSEPSAGTLRPRSVHTQKDGHAHPQTENEEFRIGLLPPPKCVRRKVQVDRDCLWLLVGVSHCVDQASQRIPRGNLPPAARYLTHIYHEDGKPLLFLERR